MQSSNILKLYRFNGIETYSITDASVAFRDHETSGSSITFQVSETVRVDKLDSAEAIVAEPQVMATARVEKKIDDSSLVGRSFSIPKGYDEAIHEDVAWIYYYSYEDLDENVVTILQIDANRARLRWVATACDVDYYDGSKPRVRVEVESWAEIIRL